MSRPALWVYDVSPPPGMGAMGDGVISEKMNYGKILQILQIRQR